MELLRTNPPLPTFAQLVYAARHAPLGLREAVPETYEHVLSACALLLAGLQGTPPGKELATGYKRQLDCAAVLRLCSWPMRFATRHSDCAEPCRRHTSVC